MLSAPRAETESRTVEGSNEDDAAAIHPQERRVLAVELDDAIHLAGRAFSVVVHGDAEGAETLRRILVDWLCDIGLVSAGHAAELDRYVGYYKPYATSHDELDRDEDFQEEVRNAARTLIAAVRLKRNGSLPDEHIPEIRPK